MTGDSSLGGLDRLYPFLAAGAAVDAAAGGHDAAVLADAAWSAGTKAAEIAELRDQVAARYAEPLAACAEAVAGRLADGGRLFTFGNGGSSTDAQDLATAFLHPRYGRPLPALALTTDVAVVTALSNDVGFEVVFARQLAALGRPGDVAVGLSTSGGSANLAAAFEEAGRGGMLTVGLAGHQGGRLAELAAAGLLDHLFVVPSSSVHRIQEAQTTIYHVLWEAVQHVLAVRAGPPGRRLAQGP
ncbi:phosphoheptose isomerase [Sphaerisporangium rufum]|uniref:Phosphoheptose isomerase n=1 Tax=Sphaerisporangium rufum TaxID=1381558 RepID=A0A919R2C3_9ACTN|nr:SIS domain-containing protein [Sphaerisporangium rufum]GII78377.1 phosphoheptose isomerase [Sphaerisporangium rufum]